jgi:hypothetical protein
LCHQAAIGAARKLKKGDFPWLIPPTTNPLPKHRRTLLISNPVPVGKPVYARLPLAPRNASPVPHLTSLYHFHLAGEYGDRNYPGNCGGKLIRDLLLFFRSQNVFDPMTGSGTCADVCREMGIPCLSRDIRQGFDATDADCFRSLPADSTFDFVWAHPPYWRQKIYTPDSRDLSRTPTVCDGYVVNKSWIILCGELFPALILFFMETVSAWLHRESKQTY